MPQHNDTLYLGHMLDAARWIARRLAGLQQRDFDANEDLQLAVTHQLQIIGEAARLVSDATRQQLAQVPWRQITGMRHRLVHDYVNVDFGLVWTTATRDLAPLIAELEKVVPTTPP